MKEMLWYKEPANPNIWEEALPLGNGSLGAMLFGGVEYEHVQLNQDTVWYGQKRNRINPDALSVLPMVRDLIFQGKLSEAEELAYNGMYGTPTSQGHYEPLGDLRLVFDQSIPHYSESGKERKAYSNYHRELDLEEATYRVSYEQQGTVFRRKAYISYPHQVMVMEIDAQDVDSLETKKVSLRIELSRGDQCESVRTVDGRMICLEGFSGGQGPRFVAIARVEAIGGEVQAIGSYLKISDADKVIVYLAGRTSYYQEDPYDWCMNQTSEALRFGASKIYAEHVQDYQKLYQKVKLELSNEENYTDQVTKLSTKERLQRVKEGAEDVALVALYFQYGRYLLLSCSRPGSMPANLQGIWNKEMMPPWGAKYTININTEMNYWPACVTNLDECQMPLFEHLHRMFEQGKEVAQKMYGCRGIAAHHNTDIYGDCAPQDQWMPATIWPMGAAWLATHILEHFRFTQDIEFLKQNYEVVYEAAIFFTDYLILDEQGQLVTCPSTSPENTYILENGEKSALCYGPSMDAQIIRFLWEGLIEVSKRLNIENDSLDEISRMLGALPETRQGSRGQILEWTKEYLEWEPGHRHISHLFALHPGNQISKSKTPELFDGAKITLNERLSQGGGHTGWSRAWIINMWARLLDGEQAYENLIKLFEHSTADNLFDMHPPFQIDGNFGATAGIAEMLLQSHEGFLRFLPALPSAWKNGHVKGLKARGDFEVELQWKDGILQVIRIIAHSAGTLRWMEGDCIREKSMAKNELYTI